MSKQGYYFYMPKWSTRYFNKIKIEDNPMRINRCEARNVYVDTMSDRELRMAELFPDKNIASFKNPYPFPVLIITAVFYGENCIGPVIIPLRSMDKVKNPIDLEINSYGKKFTGLGSVLSLDIEKKMLGLTKQDEGYLVQFKFRVMQLSQAIENEGE